MTHATHTPRPTLFRFARFVASCAAVFMLVGAGLRVAHAQGTYQDLDAAAQGMEVTEHLGQTIPLELNFTTSDGKQVYLKDYFTKTNKPAVVAMVFYKCPIACQAVMQRFSDCLNAMDFSLGKDFNALYFSIDSSETAELAKQTKEKILTGYNKEITDEVRASWQFHVGEAASNKQLSDSLGFPYRPLEDGTFSHPIALFILSPEGKIVRYIHGFSYDPRDVKLALMEASSGRLGKSIGDRFLGFCYMYDPNTGKYTIVARRVMQVGGVLMIFAVGSLVGVMLVSERILKKRLATEAAARVSAPQATSSAPSVSATGPGPSNEGTVS